MSKNKKEKEREDLSKNSSEEFKCLCDLSCDWDAAFLDSTNNSLLERGIIQPEDL